MVSVYLLYRAVGLLGTAILGPIGAGILIVAVIAYLATRFVPGYGIKAPLFIPGLAALLCGLLFTGGTGLLTGVTAFVAGTAGTLLGAGIAWLPRAKETRSAPGEHRGVRDVRRDLPCLHPLGTDRIISHANRGRELFFTVVPQNSTRP